ncbi:uncharacterized protein LOC123531956 [Mercenaria mercenaria]|uniref:uncharacterized protein LOC123531956 n=1 Tax=Mercenaria mercenaria TaxID=6596 RepID=UPI00234E8933|nr:uncharacterized protein LOC123531956 [Mercenaria mercenaria]
MEREIVWLNKEAKSKEGRELREIIPDERTVTTKLEGGDGSQYDGDSDDNNDHIDENDDEWASDASSGEKADAIKGMVNGMVDEVTRQTDGVEASIETRPDCLRPNGDGAEQEVSEMEKRGNSLMSTTIKLESDIDNIREETVEKKTDNTKFGQNSNDVTIEENNHDSLPIFDDLAKPDIPTTDVPVAKQYLLTLVETKKSVVQLLVS